MRPNFAADRRHGFTGCGGDEPLGAPELAHYVGGEPSALIRSHCPPTAVPLLRLPRQKTRGHETRGHTEPTDAPGKHAPASRVAVVRCPRTPPLSARAHHHPTHQPYGPHPSLHEHSSITSASAAKLGATRQCLGTRSRLNHAVMADTDPQACPYRTGRRNTGAIGGSWSSQLVNELYWYRPYTVFPMPR